METKKKSSLPLWDDDGSGVAFSNVFQQREKTLLIHFTPPIFAQPVTLLLLTWMMDDDDGEGDVGDDGWWMMMTVIIVMMVTFFKILGCTALWCRVSKHYPSSHTSFLSSSPPRPLQVYHPNCQNDLIRPHYVHIITHAYTRTQHTPHMYK